MLVKLFEEMREDVDGESISSHYKIRFDDYLDCLYEGNKLYKETENKITKTRKAQEKHYHQRIKHQMFSLLQEIKYYSYVDIQDTRRLISVNSDCISAVHILLRDKIYINVYFRSSDLENALPVDLEFICSLPFELIHHLETFQDTKGYEEVTDELIVDIKYKQIELNMLFGSLHKKA